MKSADVEKLINQVLTKQTMDNPALQAFITGVAKRNIELNLIEKWQRALVEYELTGLTGFVERWNRLDNFLGRSVKLLIGPREVHGIVKGIDHQGGIVIETDNGLETYIGGEVSLRKNRH